MLVDYRNFMALCLFWLILATLWATSVSMATFKSIGKFRRQLRAIAANQAMFEPIERIPVITKDRKGSIVITVIHSLNSGYTMIFDIVRIV